MTRTAKRSPKQWASACALFTAILVLVAGSVSAETGRCYSADIPAAMVLPDGSVHGAGELRICYQKKFTPVSGLHRTYVDGRVIGVFMSLSQAPEEGGNNQYPFFVFQPNALGEYVFQGYATPSARGLVNHQFPSVVTTWQLGEGVQASLTQEEDETEAIPLILVAAARR